jgi:hypothetical protein
MLEFAGFHARLCRGLLAQMQIFVILRRPSVGHALLMVGHLATGSPGLSANRRLGGTELGRPRLERDPCRRNRVRGLAAPPVHRDEPKYEARSDSPAVGFVGPSIVLDAEERFLWKPCNRRWKVLDSAIAAAAAVLASRASQGTPGVLPPQPRARRRPTEARPWQPEDGPPRRRAAP